MDYVCLSKNCRPNYAKTLEGLASVVVAKILVSSRKSGSKDFEAFFAEVFYFSRFMRPEYTFTLVLKRSVLDDNAPQEFRYYKSVMIETKFQNLLNSLRSRTVEKLYFVNTEKKSDGESFASLDCACGRKKGRLRNLDYFFWRDEIEQ